MSSTKTALTGQQLEQATAVVAAWLGAQMGLDGPAPTGHEAANRGMGPVMVEDFDWGTSGPTPTLVLEGGPYDWAVEASMDEGVCDALRALGMWSEPYAGWSLCLYALSAL